MKEKALELAERIKAWREDEVGDFFSDSCDLLNDEIEPFLRSLAAGKEE